ncbi:hypothetical protein [Cellulophaga baltica]|uniref:hypothetical protein n=1 Tax=Cellulophaga baltica TaxID=76594 RepID=UPI002494E299|nr:hypothetical protein [Cellulophaga baltica]
MDSKPLEEQAENHLKSQLLRFDFKIAKPSFDKLGSDLLIVDSIKSDKTRFLIIQSKGRTLTKNRSSNIQIPKKYLADNFVVFLYTIDEEKNESLFMFTSADIESWNYNKGKFTLSFNSDKISSYYFSEKLFDNRLAKKLKEALIKVKVKNYTSVIIDAIFLERAINKTISVYSGIWPKKKFIKPNLNTVLKDILDFYDHYQGIKKIVNCYVIQSEHFDLNSLSSSTSESGFITKTGNQVNVFKSKTKNIVAFEVLEQIDRLINNDNIILVADDSAYEVPLEGFKENGLDIIMILFNEYQGREIYVDFKWGDIIYPLGISIGLERHEL